MAIPYTYAMHAARCVAQARQYLPMARQHVQVKKEGVAYCAQLLEPLTPFSGPDCWIVETLQPQRARFSVAVRNVTQCAGLDGNCTCAGETQADRGSFSCHESAGGSQGFGAVTCM